jgi:glycosyltransferase involved in cell wall biosynthesis
MPDISVAVIVPVRNGRAFIGEALESILGQSVRPYEILVIDDGSTDDTATEVRRFSGVTYMNQEALGQSAARNHGARLASASHLSFLDADDVWTARKLELQLAAMEADPTLEVVSGRMVQFRTGEKGHRVICSQPSTAHLPGLMLMTRSAFWRVGPYATQWPVGETIDWWARAREAGVRSMAIEDIVLMRRLHQRNLGRTTADPMKNVLSILHSAVQRRRGRNA